MNKLILVGNGFDLSHGLRTDYNSFLVAYLKKCLAASFESGEKIYEDELISVKTAYPNHTLEFSGQVDSRVSGIPQLVDFFYAKDLQELLNKEYLGITPGQQILNPFKIKVKSRFFSGLIAQCKNSNWVDIENEFYSELKDCIDKDFVDVKGVRILNASLKAIIRELEWYLSQLDTSVKIEEYFNIIHPYPSRETYDQTMILNFNYTDTVEKYLSSPIASPKNGHASLDYIHGKIGDALNPLIFGFGDELDKRYHDIELVNENDFFEHIKSFWYFKTRNYTNLIRFIQQEYDIFILGHSCGLSDRTLLNMVFEHGNCKSIKIFYHQTERGNNFTNLTYEISRHFKNKVQMRERISPFPDCQAMPQFSA